MSSTAATGCAPTATARGRCSSRRSASRSTSASPRRCRRAAATTPRAQACRTCPARSRSVRTSTSSCSRRPAAVERLDLRLPLRAAIGVQRSPDVLGVTFSPHLNLDLRDVGGWNVGLLAGPLFADRRYHQHFYGVDAGLRDAAAAGLPGARRLRRLAGAERGLAPHRQLWVGALRALRQPARRGLRRQPAGPARPSSSRRGVGVSWVFATSDRQVTIDD